MSASKLVELSLIESDTIWNALRSQLFPEGGSTVAGDTRWLDDDEQQTWRAFLTAERLLFDRLERQLQRDAGLPHAYYEILVRLSEAPDRTLRMSQLADSSLSSRSRLSHAVARLEAAGWVRRRACDEDRRGSFAELTPEGLAKLEDAAAGHVEAVRTNLFDALTREQQHALREISDTLVAQLSETPVWPADGDGEGGTRDRVARS
jgi:DNA-binding MarR family transcriptional regulator